MNKTAKALLIPVAAFAVTATGVSAFNSDVLERAGLNDDQIAAFTEAHELRQDGDRDAARDVLLEAGIDLETMHTVRRAIHAHRHAHKSAIHDAVEANDYAAFQDAIAGSPLMDIITTAADFEQFVAAHELREAGELAQARAIMDELGIEKPDHRHGPGGLKGNGPIHGHLES